MFKKHLHKNLEVICSRKEEEKERLVVFIVVVKAFYVFASEEETFPPSVGNQYFPWEGSVSTLAPHQLHLS